ncbi:MAG: uL15 family ribosomal protein [Candidatus Woesearchaeota archaeon]
MLNRRKKAIKFRGHHTHGYGSKKKHRGSGHQGGVGMAGSGKKADQKKPSIWKDTKYFGRHGFVSKNVTEQKTLNIFYLEEHFDNLVKGELIRKEGDVYTVTLKDFKCNKLLASGTPIHAYKITAPYASAAAIRKIQEAGGSVEGILPKKEKKVKDVDAKKKK